MKRMTFSLLAALLAMPLFLHAQDAATEERINRLSAQIEVLLEAKNAQNKRIDELSRQLREVQEQQNKPNASYATAEDIKRLADKLKEIDEKRVADNQKIVKEIEKLANNLAGSGSRRPAPVADTSATAAPPSGKFFEYTVQQGDTLGAIVKAYRDQNIPVTLQQVLAANPGLKPESMRIGQKVYIPAPQ